MDINTVKSFASKKWFNHSNRIDHPFQMKVKLARKEFIQRVLVYHNQQYKESELQKLAIANSLCSDANDISKSVNSNATDPYYLLTGTELFKVLKKGYFIGFCTTMDLV